MDFVLVILKRFPGLLLFVIVLIKIQHAFNATQSSEVFFFFSPAFYLDALFGKMMGCNIKYRTLVGETNKRPD